MSRTVKIVTLNLWRYYDWSNRYEKIIKVLEYEKPDIIALQEVQLNLSFSPKSQAQQIAEELGYKHFIFSPSMLKSDQIDNRGQISANASHGLAIISNFPILQTETMFLTKHDGDTEYRMAMFAKIDTGGQVIDLCNAHLSNSDRYAPLQLEELSVICSSKQATPIILGDLNIYDLSKLVHLFSGYTSSYSIKPYISYPKDKGTLDYILLPQVYEFIEVNCLDDGISDHRAVCATVNLN